MNVKGKWSGTIVLGKDYRKLAGSKIYFAMRLTQNNQNFEGSSTDTAGSGIHPQPASISGMIDGKNITFVKQYPTLHYFNHKSELVIDISSIGPEIIYKGKIDETFQKITGEWSMKNKSYIFGLIPWSFTNSGTWSMEKDKAVGYN